jgi:TolB-like protein/DNA-binding winged helix-turn-helix (wHTH) protein/Flp pilus assembly protein TadD
VNSSPQSPQGYRFGIFEIDLEARELRKNGLTVPLQDQPFKILVAMVRRAGRVILREELYLELSSYRDYDPEQGLNNAILRIRGALGDSRENARFIQTLPGRGYRFLPQVEVIYKPAAGDNNRIPELNAPSQETEIVKPQPEIVAEVAPPAQLAPTDDISPILDPVPVQEVVPAPDVAPVPDRAPALDAVFIPDVAPPPSIGPPEPPKPPRWSFWLRVTALLVIVAVPLSVYLAWKPSTITLVVVPFLNMSSDSAQEYIAEGVSEQMITELSRLNPQRLRVIARTTSWQLKGTHKSAAQIGRELNANYMLEGSIQREGDRIRVTAQLIKTSDQTHAWARSYDGDLSDILKMEGTIAQSVATEIQVVLSQETRERLASKPRVKPEAQLAYLQGLQDMTRRTKEGQLAAIADFNSAIAIEPGYAAAYAGLARAYTIAPVSRAYTSSEAFSRANEAATKALQLDPTLAEPHSYLGFTKAHWEFDWPGAEREYLEALKLDPNSSVAHLYYAHSYLTPLGRHDEAIAEIKKAIELDPLSLVLPSFIGRTYVLARRYDDALAQLKKMEEKDPTSSINHIRLAQLYAYLGRYQEAIAEEVQARTYSGEDITSAGAHGNALKQAYDLRGPRGYWQKELEFADEAQNPPEANVTAFGRAILYAELGDKENALDWLEKAYADRDLHNDLACKCCGI